MLTATRDLLLPTTVTGSWPRPSWYDTNLFGRPFSTGMGDVRFRELFVDDVGANRGRVASRRGGMGQPPPSDGMAGQ